MFIGQTWNLSLLMGKIEGGLPWWLSGKETTCQCRRLGFDPWVRKIPWSRKCQPTPVFLPWKSHGQRSLVDCSPLGCKELDTTEWLILFIICYSFANIKYSFLPFGNLWWKKTLDSCFLHRIPMTKQRRMLLEELMGGIDSRTRTTKLEVIIPVYVEVSTSLWLHLRKTWVKSSHWKKMFIWQGFI